MSASGAGSATGPAADQRCQRGLPGFGMHRAVVDGFDPGREEPIQLGQIGDVVAADDVGLAGDLDQELLTHGPEESLDFASAFGPAWCGMHQAHTEFRARPQQPRIDERRAAINVDRLGDTAGGQRRAQRGGQPHGVLGIAPPVAGQQPGMIV